MKFIAYKQDKESQASGSTNIGVLIGNLVAPVATLEDFYADVPRWTEFARNQKSGTLFLNELQKAIPVPLTAKVICAAINYVEHGKEGGLPTPSFPNLFARWTSTLSTSGTPVKVPHTEPDGIDWEVELGVIIGKKINDATEQNALDGVLGYTTFNDISGRASQIQSMTLSTGQWAIGKNLDNSGAIGSVIASADSVDVKNLRITAKVNDQFMQDGTTADMIFSVSKLIEFISQSITLNPGDLIVTGTPAGVGFGRKPRVYAKKGDVMEVEVHGICAVQSPII
jgi:2,4-didehydro-3-deoxy-L-rhamnonate hydrolase